VIKKILVANRGEIAVRIVRACSEMGIKSVAIYTDADRHALHVKKADEAYHIGSEPVTGYLNAHNIVNIAVTSGCDALHPGYGFLAENPELAEICARRDIKFIGPNADVIRQMGDKVLARNAMMAAGIPCIPGSDGNLADVEEARILANKIGYPIMLKATNGGGGRGIRRCDSDKDLLGNYERVISEANKAFGQPEVFLEKCIVNPKHIEVQVLGDSHGNMIHLFERDCSIQRRNQKLIEIAPSPQITPEQREYIGNLGVKAARAVSYENAGTIEFLLDQDGSFYFMEMNTRIQVEHTVSETITGTSISCRNRFASPTASSCNTSRKTSGFAAMRWSFASMRRIPRTAFCRVSAKSPATMHRVAPVCVSMLPCTATMKYPLTSTPCAPSSPFGRSLGRVLSNAVAGHSAIW